jgi:hypothetical protein
VSTAISRVQSLLIRLSERTNAGAITWIQGSTPDTFIYSGTRASVALSTQDGDGAPPYVVTLYDESGNAVDAYTARPTQRNVDWFKIVQRLYQAARRKALNIDVVIDALEADLGDAPAEPINVDDIPF